MTKNTKGIVAVLGVAAVAAAAFYFYSHTKQAYARTIVKLGGANNYATLLTFEEDFLKAWARAIQKGKQTFLYNSANYATAGGKRINA